MDSIVVTLSAQGAFQINTVTSWTLKRNVLTIRMEDKGIETSSDLDHLLQAKQIAIPSLLNDGRITRVHNFVIGGFAFENISDNEKKGKGPLIILANVMSDPGTNLSIVKDDLKPRQYIEALDAQIKQQLQAMNEAQLAAAQAAGDALILDDATAVDTTAEEEIDANENALPGEQAPEAVVEEQKVH